MSLSPALNPRPSSAPSQQRSMFGSSLSSADTEKLTQSLKSYKYKSPNLSLFERLWLNEFWNRMPDWFYPSWLAPNLITFCGFWFIVLAQSIELYYSPDFHEGLPSWWYILAALCIFIYQTLDGSDGKQARKTKSGSPLGELFDHGVDALVTSSIFMMAVNMLGLGMFHPLAFCGLMLTQLSFYFSNLTLLHCEVQTFNDLDCQEIQVVIQVAMILTYFYPDMWATVIHLPEWASFVFQFVPSAFMKGWGDLPDDPHGYRIRGLILLLALFFQVINDIKAYFHIFLHYSLPQDAPLKEGQGRNGLNFQTLSFGLFGIGCYFCWGPACGISAASELAGNGHTNTTTAYFLVSAYAFGDLMNHSLITRVGQLPFPAVYRNRGLWCLLAFYISLVYFSENSSLHWAVAVATIASHTQYCFMMGNAITQCLGIRFFIIKAHSATNAAAV